VDAVTGLGIGLDIGGTKTLGVLTDAQGRVLAKVRRPTQLGAAGVVDTAVAVVDELRARGVEGLWPIGVGVPGLVDVGTGVVKHAVNLDLDGEWVQLRSELEARIGHPVLVENDVNAAALGATALLPAGTPADLAYLSIGTGLAAGLVLDGRLRRGVHGAAGEIGHVPVDPAGALCQCGQRGCLETIASGSAMAAAFPAAGEVHAATAVFAAASEGDGEALGVRDRFAHAVAAAVRLLCLTVDVEAVVLGGGVAQIGEPLRVAVAAALDEQAKVSAFLDSLRLADRLSVVPAEHPVAAVGAAFLGRPQGL
jgi:glucokinase